MATRTARPRISQHEILRRQRGFLLTQLATELQVSHPYVSLIEGRQKQASERYRQAVASLLKVPEDVIFDEDGWVR